MLREPFSFSLLAFWLFSLQQGAEKIACYQEQRGEKDH
jgi:hypothetical protein